MKKNHLHQQLIVRTLVITICSSFASGCAVDPVTGRPSLKETFASDDPCSQNARNIGIGVGILAGAILGKQVGGSNKGLLLGAAMGGAIGGLIGNDMDKRRCELSKIAKQYNLDVQVTSLNSDGQTVTVQDSNTAKKNDSIGSIVEIRDPASEGGHFESNSDKLTARAQQYFAAIADTYNAQKSAADIQDPKLKAQYLTQIAQRKILLVGHTDDTGSTRLNADLSERRARAVSKFMEDHGIPKESLFFQGAGEFYPVADNNTEEGRARNRRVEIIELNDKSGFDNYLASRKPRIEFYRVQNASTPAVGSNAAPSLSVQEKKSSNKPVSPSAGNVAKSNPVKVPVHDDSIDFGGAPLLSTAGLADIGKVESKKPFFSLISTAYADEPAVVNDCTQDRPRASNSVKALSDGNTYKTSEHIPGLYGKTWTDQVNGHQIVINKLAVLAGDGALANPPEFKVYKNYDPSKRNNLKPDVSLKPEVNTYLGSKGLLYRMFIHGQGGMQCVDIVFETNGGNTAKAGKLVYTHAASAYVADFKPKMYQ